MKNDNKKSPVDTVDFHLPQVKPFLERYHQHQILDRLLRATPEEQHLLIEQLAPLARYLPLILSPLHKEPPLPPDLKPFIAPTQEDTSLHGLGQETIKQGKVMGILLAGGDGSRLGFSQPKGCFPTSPIMKKSLFQLHVEKIVALEKKLQCSLGLTILTSENNYQETVAFFKKHELFGLKPSQLFFLIQEMFPLYDQQNHWIMKNPSEFLTAPSGNGNLLKILSSHPSLFSSYEYFTVTNIDNALASLYDIPLISAHLHHHVDISLRCFKHDPIKDRVGYLALSHGQLRIIDYTSIQDPTPFVYGNINTFCFSQKWLHTLCQHVTLPIHWVEKEATYYDPVTHSMHTGKVLKGEQFLSDALAYTVKTLAFDSLAEEHFAPLKHLKGANDLASVHKAMLLKDQKIFEDLTGFSEKHAIELAMEFHYPTETLKAKCRELKGWPSHSYLSSELL